MPRLGRFLFHFIFRRDYNTTVRIAGSIFSCYKIGQDPRMSAVVMIKPLPYLYPYCQHSETVAVANRPVGGELLAAASLTKWAG